MKEKLGMKVNMEMTMMIKLKELNEAKYEVLVESSDKVIGYFIQEDDGYFYFILSEASTGLWSDYTLLELGTKLRELNKPWEDYFNEHFKNDKEE